MESTQATLLLASLGTIKGVLQMLGATVVVFGLAYAGASRVAALRGRALKRAFRIIRKSRRQTWRARRDRREAVATSRDLAGQMVELRREAHETSRKSRRLEAINAKLDRGCKTKSAELDKALDDLRWAKRMIPPASTWSPPTLTDSVISQPVDFDPTSDLY